jgi:hypothetical protein
MAEAKTVFGVEYELTAGGAIAYTPAVAHPSRGFGPYEVHPQKLPCINADGSLDLKHNGDWMLLFADVRIATDDGRRLLNFVITAKHGGRQAAETLAYVRNAGKPTRVVDLAGVEHTWVPVTGQDWERVEAGRAAAL